MSCAWGWTSTDLLVLVFRLEFRGSGLKCKEYFWAVSSDQQSRYSSVPCWGGGGVHTLVC